MPRTKRRWLAWLLQPLSPLSRPLASYRRADLPHDLLAGVTVAVVDLPQSMAFAVVAGVPAVYGLYTSIVLGLLGSLFTASPFLSVGATNTQSLLVAAIVSRLTAEPQLYLQLVFGLALLKGLVQLAFAAARMGRLVRYVSRSVMVPFAAAAGALVVAGQLPTLLGLPREPAQRYWPGVPGAIERLILHAHDANLRTLALGLGTLAVLLVAQRWTRAMPGPLLAVVGSALFVWLSGWTDADTPLIGALPHGLPALSLPQLDTKQVEALLPGAIAIALLGMLESVMIGKTVAQPAGQSVDPDQELFSQGLANLIGSLLQCIPGSGSFSRTALQQRPGARTRLAGVFCSLFNAVVFLAFARFASTIPLAALAAILLLMGAQVVDLRSLRRIARASRPDAVVCWATLIAALALPLTYAIYIGIFLSIALYLRHAGRLQLHEIVPTESGGFEERPLSTTSGRELVLVQLDGDLFFAVADDLSEQLARLERCGVSVVIFRLKRTRWMDASVMLALEQFVTAMRARGAHVLLCGVRPELRQGMRGFGLEAAVGPDNVFATEPGVFASAKRALGRARELTGVSRRGALLALLLTGCAAAPPRTATPSREVVVDEAMVVQGRSPRSGDELPLLPRALAETSPAFQSGYAAAEPLLRTPGPASPADGDQATYDAWLTSTLLPWLDARGHEVESALRPLSEVTQGPPSERVVAAALAGLIYVHTHDQLLQVPAPPSVRADERLLRIYEDQVHETSATFVENATRALRACAVSAAAQREPIYGPWLDLCQRQLGALEQQQKAAAALHAQVSAEREAEASQGGGADAAPEQRATPTPPDAGTPTPAELPAR